MRSGQRKNRLTFSSPSVTTNAFGEKVETYADVETVWGSVRPIHGTELSQANQRKSLMTHAIEVGYRSDMVPTARWKIYDETVGVYYQIEAVRFDPTRRANTPVFIDAVETVTGQL